MSLQLPPCELVGVDDQMIPTGKRYDYDVFSELSPIGSDVLDNCFAIKKPQKDAVFLLKGERGALTFRQDKEDGHLHFFQVFTPPHRCSLALEPMTCNINAFNNEEGLIRLPPGEKAKLSFRIEFSRSLTL